MGYLDIASSSLPNFSKAVISLWFRIPDATLTAARAQYDAANAVFPNTDFSLIGVVPLLTLGPNTETYANHNGVAGAVTSTGPISPCVIGVSCGDARGTVGRQNVLYARMQYASGAAAAVFPNNVYNDYFQVGAQLSPCNIWGGAASGSAIVVSADTVHHILISFDLSGGCGSTYSSPNLAIDSSCPFYWAFDDVNYSSGYLWPNTPRIVGATDIPNGIFSDRCNQNSGAFSFAAGNIPTFGNPMGVPSSSGNSGKIYKVELAELQIFTGVTLDTSIEANRRAFITVDGVPANMSLAVDLLGQEPDIKLHGSNNWKAGLNTGSLGTTFTPTGTITTYATTLDITP